ncbi:MAG: GH1 family beta-glucosidase [Bacillus subtilis]|nr:GH1 family beta-glucosidase [Bacillus subtilis]
MSEYRFPEDFLFGAATSALQIEGAAAEDGRGKTIWDVVNHDADGRPTGDVPDVACDHYHRFEEDVQLMRELGLQTYRFSVSWPRVMPEQGEINPKGLAFYRKLIDALKTSGIQPAVTIWHGDLPLWLEAKGGWKNRETIDHYLLYAKTLFDAFGADVDMWFTHNEPWCAAFLNNDPLLEQLTIAHHLLLAHAKCVAMYRSHPNGTGAIGIVLNLAKQYAHTTAKEDQAAANNIDGFLNRWFLDPVLKGSYPSDMLELYRNAGHAFHPSDDDMAWIAHAKSDFIGVNMYSRGIQKHNPENTLFHSQDVAYPDAKYSDMGWEICPDALADLLVDLHRTYDGIPIIIAENGGAFPDQHQVDGVIVDTDRQAYLEGHLRAVGKALRDGVRVKRYYVWSLFDNFEWGLGYSKRFGIVRVDYETQTRTIKQSGRFYQRLIRDRGWR